jgi:outer membrane protein assembly factor BamB
MRRFGIFLLAIISATLASADWLRFRGPNGTGTTDAALPVRWKAEDILWKVSIPGVGHSSPVIGAGHVYLQSASEDGRERWLLCLDAATGKLLWKATAPGQSAHTHKRNTLASSTPALDDKRVYAVFWDGKKVSLCAFDLQGTRLWQQDLGDFRSQHGPGFSPVVIGDKVVVTNDQDGSAVLLAFDTRSGEPAWKAERKAYRACYSTPFLLDSNDGKQLIVVSTAGVTGYDPKSGKELWNCTWPPARMPLRTVSSPVFVDGLVVATAGDGAGDRLAIAVKPGGSGDVTATNIAWEDRKAFPYVPSLLGLGKHIYSVNDNGFIACHLAATGGLLRQERLTGAVTASPLLAAGKVYAVTEEGDVLVYSATPELKRLAVNHLGERVIASPAAADDHLFIRGQEHLFCIGKR